MPRRSRSLGGLTLHLGFIFALACAFLLWFVLNRTRKGYEIRLIGDNPRAARYAGINIGRNVILVMLASGGLAGLAGMAEISGTVHRLQDGIATGAGFTGVIIAYLARFNPFGVVIAAILFGALLLAGRQDPACRDPGHDPGHRPVLCHRQRHPGSLPRPVGPPVNPELILASGVAGGTILLFAAIGEIFAERSGIINLGVEGMMFVGALAGFKIGIETGNPWFGLAMAMAAGALLSLLHAIVCIQFQADQIVSGLALTFLGIGVALVLGDGLSTERTGALLPTLTIPVLSSIPLVGRAFFTDQSILVYVGYLLVPVAYVWIDHTRPGLHLRAVGERPSAADALGINVYRTRYAYTLVGGALAGLAGATISMAITPGWFADQATSGLGWIAVGLVIFAQWSPGRAMVGAYLIAVIRRLTLDLQGPSDFLGVPNPFFHYQPSTFFLNMLPYALVILVLVIGSGSARRRRLGAPASLGVPYVRGERGD